MQYEKILNETTPCKKITRKELYEKFPYLKNLSLKDMIDLINQCFIYSLEFKNLKNIDGNLIYCIKCYMHSYPELSKQENFEKIFEE